MRPRFTPLALAVVAVAALTAFPPPAARAQDAEPALACLLTIDGPLDTLTERTMEMRVRRALERSPRFLIVSINSPGGEYDASRTIAWNLHNLEGVETIAFVRGHALSGATFVAFGCNAIVMRPDGQLGDSMPITMDVFGLLAPEVAEKMLAPVRADLRDLARRRGYPLEAAEAMVDPRIELHRVSLRGAASADRAASAAPATQEWVSRETLAQFPQEKRARIVEDVVVCPAGRLLVIGPEEALAMGIAVAEAQDEQAMCARLAEELSIAGGVRIERVDPLWWEDVVRWLTWWPIKTLLFIVGVIALAVAASTYDAVAVGTAVLAFVTLFFGSYLIGLADSVEVALFVLGLVLLVVELVTPGFGVIGVTGIVLVLLSLLLSYQRFLVPTTPAEWVELQRNLLATAGGFAGSLVGLAVAARYLPATGLLGHLIHRQPLAQAPATSPAQEAGPVGASGVAATMLRPSGRVTIGAETFDAVARDGYVAAGLSVVVVGHQGSELVVAPRPEAQPAPAPERGGAGSTGEAASRDLADRGPAFPEGAREARDRGRGTEP